MHLGFLTPEYPHLKTNSAAGIGTSVKNMVISLVNQRMQVTVFVYGQEKDETFIEDGINFHLIKQRRYKFMGWYFHRKFLQDYLNKLIRKEGIDALEAPDWTGITALMKIKCPLIVRFHGSDAYFCQLENRPQKKKNFWFEKMALKGADRLISVSHFTASQTKAVFGLKKEIEVIPNSVNVKTFCPRSTPVIPNTILYFGSIIRKKGVLELAGIFNHIIAAKPETKLLLAGKDVKDVFENISTKKLFFEQLSPEARNKAQWLGMLPYEKVLQQIAAANVVVLPSFAEALPMTWIEAMSMEKALVTSNIGWAQEVMINEGTGYIVDPKDHQVYAGKVLQLLNDPALAKKMGKAARERVVEKFSTEVVVRKNIDFYEKVIVGKNTARLHS